MPVKTSAQSLLVQEVGNETNRATEHEETVEHTHLEVVFRLFRAEGAAVPEQVDKADGDTAVDVENQVVLLGGGDSFDGDGVVEELGAGEVGLAELLDEGNAEVRVVAGLDTVTNTGDCHLLAFARRNIQMQCDLLSLFSFLIVSTKSRGERPLSYARVNSSAAPSRAPPNREPMVKRPETSAEIRSLPARVVMIVFMAPETAGPWSAVSMSTISRKRAA